MSPCYYYYIIIVMQLIPFKYSYREQHQQTNTIPVVQKSCTPGIIQSTFLAHRQIKQNVDYMTRVKAEFSAPHHTNQQCVTFTGTQPKVSTIEIVQFSVLFYTFFVCIMGRFWFLLCLCTIVYKCVTRNFFSPLKTFLLYVRISGLVHEWH